MHNFAEAKKRAISELYEINKKATENAVFNRGNSAQASTINIKNILNGFNLSLSDDDIIVIGLLLILSKDCHDKWLFLALIYILL